jgi:hypothetical protein
MKSAVQKAAETTKSHSPDGLHAGSAGEAMAWKLEVAVTIENCTLVSLSERTALGIGDLVGGTKEGMEMPPWPCDVRERPHEI